MSKNIFKFKVCTFKKSFLLNMVVFVSFALPSFSYAENFLCRPWSNVLTGVDIGNSFTSQIRDGGISFLGEKRPVAFAQLIYSHPLNDIFLAGSGEIVTAGPEGNRVRINVYFPNKVVQYFVTSSCSRV